MNYFKLYIGDYQRDTAHLSVTEHGAYLLMLQHYYATEKPLPVGKALHRMLRAQDKAERDAIDAVAAQFWKVTDAGLVNARADEELTKAAAQADTNRAIAQQREARRKAARTEHEQSTNRATNDEPNHSHSQKEIPRASLSPPPAVGKFPPGFDQFWAAYPRKVGKDAAAKAFARRRIGADLLVKILEALSRQALSPQWTRDGGQFIPHPATWLTQGRWQDEDGEEDPYGLRQAL